MKLYDILNVNTIVAPIEADGRDSSIQELLNKLVDNGTLIASSKLLEYIENIENHQSTAAGKGVAYPHSMSIEVDNLEAILGISINGILYKRIEAKIEKINKKHCILIFKLREGKNREIRNICKYFKWTIIKLIRLQMTKI